MIEIDLSLYPYLKHSKIIKMLFTSLVFGLGGSEIAIVFIIVLVLFGGKKIPELMRGLGQGIKEFNNAKANIESEVKQNLKEIEKN